MSSWITHQLTRARHQASETRNSAQHQLRTLLQMLLRRAAHLAAGFAGVGLSLGLAVVGTCFMVLAMAVFQLAVTRGLGVAVNMMDVLRTANRIAYQLVGALEGSRLKA